MLTLREHVDRGMAALLDELTGRLASLHPTAVTLGEELRRFSAGGKRLRPVLLLLGTQLAGGSVDEVSGPALALELVHTCALLHDDLIDDATDRRGQPAAHVAFAEEHRDAGWEGDPAHYGMSAALLLGDLSHVWADEVFRRTTVPPDRLDAALGRFATMREEVTVGQFLDVRAAARRSHDAEDALEIANLKSARYSVARPLEIGAVLAVGPGALSEGLLRVGIPLGQAFQLRDDVLGVFGDEATTGKSTVSDLAEGKRTWLVAATAERLGARERDRMESLLGTPGLGSVEVDEIRAMMTSSGGLQATEAVIADLVDEALGLLADLPLDEPSRATLQQVARYLVDRER